MSAPVDKSLQELHWICCVTKTFFIRKSLEKDLRKSNSLHFLIPWEQGASPVCGVCVGYEQYNCLGNKRCVATQRTEFSDQFTGQSQAGSRQPGSGVSSLGWHGPPCSSYSDRTTSARKRNNICSEFACGGDGGGGLLREVTKRQRAGAC